MSGYAEQERGGRFTSWARWAFVVFSLACFVYMGNIKNYNGFVWDYDTRCWYTAGVCWWGGDSPYDRDRYTEVWTSLFGEPPRNHATFVYPPTMALISLPLALFPWSVAPWLYRAASLAAVFGIGFLTHRLMAPEPGARPLNGAQAWYWGACAFLASVTQCLVQGQCATIVVFGCLAAWYGWRRGHWPVFLTGFLLACIKPQISLIPLLFILGAGGTRWFLGGAALASIFSAVVLLLFPHTQLFDGYGGSLENHMVYQEFNRWSRYCGVPALLGWTSLGRTAAIAGVLAGGAAAVWLGLQMRQRAGAPRNFLLHAQCIWVVAFAAMPVHIYDLAGQIFVTATLWIAADWRVRVLGVGLMVVADRVPAIARLTGMIDPIAPLEPVLLHAGTPICAALLVILFVWHYRNATVNQTGSAGPPVN